MRGCAEGSPYPNTEDTARQVGIPSWVPGSGCKTRKPRPGAVRPHKQIQSQCPFSSSLSLPTSSGPEESPGGQSGAAGVGGRMTEGAPKGSFQTVPLAGVCMVRF